MFLPLLLLEIFVMDDMTSIFPRFNHEDWKKGFSREVGEDHLDDMNFTIDGLAFEPMADDENDGRFVGKLPKKEEKTAFGEIFDFTGGKSPIRELMDSLQHDFTAPMLLVDMKTNASVFDKVLFDILNASIHVMDGWMDAWKVYFMILHGGYPKGLRIINQKDNTGKGAISHFHFEAENEVVPFIREISGKIDEINPQNVQISMKFTGRTLHDIIKARAIKTAWLNLLHNAGLPTTPYHFEVILPVEGAYPDIVIGHTDNLIAATMAQADTIVFACRQEDNERRILRNAAHISIIEAGLNRETDPIAGSYFVEKVAAVLAEKALAG